MGSGRVVRARAGVRARRARLALARARRRRRRAAALLGRARRGQGAAQPARRTCPVLHTHLRDSLRRQIINPTGYKTHV